METKTTHIGGQAVIEGVMMRGRGCYTLAVRQPDKEIFSETISLNPITKRIPILKLPILRGVVSFVDSMYLGTKILMKAAEVAGLDDDSEGEQSKFDKFLTDKFGDKVYDVVIWFSVVVALFMSVGLFMVLPTFLSGVLAKLLKNDSYLILSGMESVIKVIIFIVYLSLVSKMEDIARVFMYHGAEHKTINCFEHGEDLIVENVKKHSRFHKRCGTSFLFIVLVISILVFTMVRVETLGMRILSRIILVPIVAGISYEIIQWAGRHDNAFVNLISKPGMALQKLTTKEPDDSQIEIAIAAMKGVLEYEKEKNSDANNTKPADAQ